MKTRAKDRRRYGRVPLRGVMRWQSGSASGDCQIIDLSPVGAALCMEDQQTHRLGQQLALDLELVPGMSWRVADAARVVRITPHTDEGFRVCVEFPPTELDLENGD